MTTDRIPESFTPVLKAVETICLEFESKEPFQSFGPEKWICDLDRAWDDEVEHVAFLLDTAAPLLAVYVVIKVPFNHEDLLAKALARANYGLLPGCFEIDLEGGEMRYRSVLSLVTTKIQPRDVAQLLSGALLMAKTYAPAFQKVAEEGSDPIGAVDEVEG